MSINVLQTPEQIVQYNLDCYNKRDIEGFMSGFSDNIELYTFPDTTPSVVGKADVRAVYQNLFEKSPNLRSTIIKRIVFNNKIIDHESIVGRMGSTTPVEMVLIYEVKEDKIFRVTAIRK